MRVRILTHTPEPEKTVAAAARLCYSSAGACEIMENLTEEKISSFIQKLMDMGHMSPTEHVTFTFAVEGVSRTLLAQLTRHRIASYSVQSLRYNNPFKEELKKEDEAGAVQLRSGNETYLKGFIYAGGEKALYKNFIEESGVSPALSGEIPGENLSHYVRGIFDAAGQIFDGSFAVAFPGTFSSILARTPFKLAAGGEKLLLSGRDAADFCLYIYGGVDFAGSLYLREKFVELCRRSADFFSGIKKQLEDYIATRYYSVLPEAVAKNPEAVLVYIDALETSKKSYLAMVKMGVDKEDARYVLPMGTRTNLVMTMNVRSLYNFFNLRCCERAQTEIRELARMMLAEVKKIAPNLFKKAGAPCEATGFCPEGDLSCGRYPVRN
ncbi:thymidylate synthase (FAD) [Thermosediminibacter litoriperuensis]|uniref:Flavin-dependent thymidylate synthase n=1 Tax=Thermosediminibacter litoriperuensis TaxID=291989 RepID=A0A5S5ACW8_9FIRM|nr:FAD-dependent thymidylate synthase [Thermosediminibacter litoriperuensis]TYP47019.1 thymidylate synthase (FAD) [Thermosediminibacter litoriperuensis]